MRVVDAYNTLRFDHITKKKKKVDETGLLWATSGQAELDEARRMSLLPASESNGKSSISRDMGSISLDGVG